MKNSALKSDECECREKFLSPPPFGEGVSLVLLLTLVFIMKTFMQPLCKVWHFMHVLVKGAIL